MGFEKLHHGDLIDIKHGGEQLIEMLHNTSMVALGLPLMHMQSDVRDILVLIKQQ